VRDTGSTDGHSAASTTALIRTASEQISRLVRAELRLSRAEMTAKARRAGVGAGLFGGAGVVALYGVSALLTALVLVLALVMPTWLAALVVTVGLFAATAVMALIGRGLFRQIGSLAPERTLESIRADVRTVSRAIHGRRQR
jgi:hypothetical protein